MDEWKRGATCFKTGNEQNKCFKASECILADGDYCIRFKGADGFVGNGRDLATVLYYRQVTTDTPASWSLQLRGTQPTWAIITAIPNVNELSPIDQALGVSGTSCDEEDESVFPSVYGGEDDVLLLSQAFDDTASASDFAAPNGTTRLGWIKSSDEAGFLFGKVLRRTGQTGKYITGGPGKGNGAECKDALLSVVVKINMASTLFD